MYVPYFRTGNKNARNVYRVWPDGTEEHVGCMFTEADGVAIVECLNAYEALLAYLGDQGPVEGTTGP